MRPQFTERFTEQHELEAEQQRDELGEQSNELESQLSQSHHHNHSFALPALVGCAVIIGLLSIKICFANTGGCGEGIFWP